MREILFFVCRELDVAVEGEGPYDVSRRSFQSNCTSGHTVGPNPFTVGEKSVHLCLVCARPPCKNCKKMYAETKEYSKPWHDEWTGFCGACKPDELRKPAPTCD